MKASRRGWEEMEGDRSCLGEIDITLEFLWCCSRTWSRYKERDDGLKDPNIVAGFCKAIHICRKELVIHMLPGLHSSLICCLLAHSEVHGVRCPGSTQCSDALTGNFF